jgi:hypothetical protein
LEKEKLGGGLFPRPLHNASKTGVEG